MNILIVEDEAPAARRLRRLVAQELSLDLDEIIVADNIDDALCSIAECKLDLLLLDLDVSGRDGFELLRAAHAGTFATVIVSANVERALAAFDHDVVDFVAKPVSAERLSRALARARETKAGEMRLAVRSRGGTNLIVAKHITHIAGADDYVEITMVTGEAYLHTDTLDTLQKRLPSNFIRVHRSHLVNMTHVKRLEKLARDKHIVVTANGDEIPVSRRRLGACTKGIEARSVA